MSETDDLFSQILNSNAKHICLIAAPGSGKTSRALIPKVQKVLAKAGADPKEVLILSFSRLSAADLKKRVGETGARASTVHSFCLSLLLSEDNHSIRKRIHSIIFDFERDTLIADLKAIFSSTNKGELKKQLDQFAAGWAINPHDEVFEENDERRAFKHAVINWLDEHEAAMMEEIVYHAVDLANKVTGLELIEKGRYIFVDEYQDLNVLEQQFVDLLAADSELLFTVGDPDQSILSFKYAHPEGIRTRFARTEVEPYSHLRTGRCAKRIIEVARALLQQSEPTRTDLPEALPTNEDGEVHFVRKDTQDDEFKYVLRQISSKVKEGVSPEDIFVLVPKKKLGLEFADYAEKRKEENGLDSETAKFKFIAKPEYSDEEQTRILLLALLANPSSILHFRCYVGIGDASAFAKELIELKRQYGNLGEVFLRANADDFSKKKSRVRRLCDRIATLREFLKSHEGAQLTPELLDEIFPATDPILMRVRTILNELHEQDDTAASLYEKFTDYIRTIRDEPNTVRIMTLMASKGLETDHVFIMGCNAGNIPGKNRSAHLSDLEHKKEQRRLLYVAFTRAKRTLTVSWARHMLFGGSKGQATDSVGTIKRKGKTYSVLAISPFLQDLPNVKWES